MVVRILGAEVVSGVGVGDVRLASKLLVEDAALEGMKTFRSNEQCDFGEKVEMQNR